MNYRLQLMSLTMLLYFVRMALPYARFVFVPILAIFTIVLILDFFKKEQRAKLMKGFMKNWPVVLLFFSVLWAVPFSEEMNSRVWKEVMNVPVLLSFMAGLFFWSDTKENFISLLKSFTRMTVWAGGLLTILGLIKLGFTMNGVELDFLEYSKLYPTGSSLVQDYNSYALAVFVGLCSLSLFYLKRQAWKDWVVHLLVFLSTTAMLYSSSRRGFVLLIMLNVALLFIWKAKREIPFARERAKSLFYASSLSFVMNFMFLAGFPTLFKSNVWDWMGFDQESNRYQSTTIFFRYYSLVNKDHNFATQYAFFYYDGVEEKEEFFKEVDMEGMVNNVYDNKTYKSRWYRWVHGLEIYATEYSFAHWLFGNGFTYLKAYQIEYEAMSLGSDYPHNPAIAALLYGGLAGLAFYLWFVVVSLKAYLKYFFELLPFSLLFFFVLIFSQMSGNTFLSLPLMVILCLFALHQKNLSTEG